MGALLKWDKAKKQAETERALIFLDSFKVPEDKSLDMENS